MIESVVEAMITDKIWTTDTQATLRATATIIIRNLATTRESRDTPATLEIANVSQIHLTHML